MKAKLIHYEMAVVANDFHLPHQDKKALELLDIFLADQKPEVFIINGDFLDIFSRYYVGGITV